MTKEEREKAFVVKLMVPLVRRTKMIYRERLRLPQRQEIHPEPVVKTRRKAALDTGLNKENRVLRTTRKP